MDYIAEIKTWVGEDEDCTISVLQYIPHSGAPYSAASDADYVGCLEFIVRNAAGQQLELSEKDNHRICNKIEAFFWDNRDSRYD